MAPESLPELRQRLSKRANRILDLELSLNGDHWRAISSVMMSCRRAGIDEDGFYRVVEVSDLGDAYSRLKGLKTKLQLRKELQKSWDKADADGWALRSELPISVRLELLLDRVLAYGWPSGVHGRQDAALAAALVSMCLGIGGRGYTLDVTVRDLAVLAGFGKSTAGRSLKRLSQDYGLCTRHRRERGKGNLGTPYSLNLDWELNSLQLGHMKDPYFTTYVPTVDRSSVRHELFVDRSGGLGAAAGSLWDALVRSGGGTAAQLVEHSGVSAGTGKKYLPRMVELELVVSEPNPAGRGLVYRPSPSADLDRAAEQLGAAGWRERTREKHRLEREVWNTPWVCPAGVLAWGADMPSFEPGPKPDPFESAPED